MNGKWSHALTTFERSWLIQLADPACEQRPTIEKDASLVAVLDTANHHRVLPTVMARLPNLLADQVPNRFREQLTTDASLMMALRATGGELIDVFAGAGLPGVIVKGEHFARHLYPRVLWRPYTDVDILIRHEHLRAAGVLMERQGFRPRAALVKHDQGYAEQKWLKECGGLTLLVELHWDLINSPTLRIGRRLSYDDVIGSDGKIDPIGDLLIACAHATFGHVFERLYHVIDIAQAARRIMGDSIDQVLTSRANQIGLGPATDMGLYVTSRILNDDILLKWAKRVATSPLPKWLTGLLNDRTLLNPRGGINPLFAWRRPVLREWLKRSGGQASQPVRVIS